MYIKKRVYISPTSYFTDPFQMCLMLKEVIHPKNGPRKALYPTYTGENVIIEDVKDKLWNQTKIPGGYATCSALGFPGFP